MSASRTSIIAHHQLIKPTTSTVAIRKLLSTADDGALDARQPETVMDYSCADAVTHMLDVHGQAGTADSWYLTAKHQLGMWDVLGNGFTTMRWFDLQSEQVAKMIAEGIDFYGGGSGVTTTLVNCCLSPSGEYGTTNWALVSATGITGNLSRESSGGYSGAHFIRNTFSGGPATAAGGGVTVNNSPVTAGTVYSVAVAVRQHSGSSAAQQLKISVGWYDSGGSQISSSSATSVTVASDTWTIFKYENLTAPASSATARINVTSTSGGSFHYWAAGDYLDMDAVLLVAASSVPAVPSYWDGDQVNCTWSGTPGNSTSTYSVTRIPVARSTDALPLTYSRTFLNRGAPLVAVYFQLVAVNPSTDFGVYLSLSSSYVIRR